MKSTSSVAIAKTREKEQGRVAPGTTRVNTEVDLEISKVGLITILAVGGGVGVLGLLFLLGGLMSAGNPLNFVSQWVQAVFGG
jgi:hypothetical protein